MNHGKYHKSSHRRLGKSITLLVFLLLIVCGAADGTLAFLTDTGERAENVFTPSVVTTSVEETLTGTTKTDVKIRNTGSTEAYIRVAVVVTWQDKDGNVYGEAPVAGTDYDITFNLNSGWKMSSDGFYYWTTPVKSAEESPNDCSTGVLITSCSPKAIAPEGYYLNVEILGSGIQSKPAHVAASEWASGVSGVSDDGTLTIK